MVPPLPSVPASLPRFVTAIPSFPEPRTADTVACLREQRVGPWLFPECETTVTPVQPPRPKDLKEGAHGRT